MNGHVFKTCGREKRGHRCALVPAHLEGHKAAGIEPVEEPGGEHAIGREPVLSAIERGTRIVVAHLGREGFDDIRADIGRVGDDEVEALAFGEGREPGAGADRKTRREPSRALSAPAT